MKNKIRMTLTFLICISMILSMVACSKTPKETKSLEGDLPKFKAGTYEAAARGNNDDVVVSVTVSENEILEVKILGHAETAGISDKPIKDIPKAIVEEQTLAVDSISGATFTSKAIISAVTECLKQAGADIEALSVVSTKNNSAPKETIEKTADVVIVGGGGAGLAAAIAATDEGASVIVIEKAANLGGNTLVCGGIYNTPDPELQEPLGIKDSPEFFAKQTWEGGDKVANFDLVKTMAHNALDGLNWLKKIGVEFNDEIIQGAGSLYRRTHTTVKPSGTGFIEAYIKNLEAKTDLCEIMMETTGESLITEGDKVVGVNAIDKHGNDVILHANNGVILATGGFAGNIELRQKYNTSGKWADLGPNVLTTNVPSVTGDGILMAEEVGANLIDMEHIQLLHLGNPKTGSTSGGTDKTRTADYVIFVNQEGKRFVREDGRRDEICNAILAQTDGIMYIIESSDGRDTPIRETPKYISNEKGGSIFIADTLEELAVKINVDPDNLVKSVKDYNAAVDSKNDPIGRELLVSKLLTGPFVATPRVPSAHHTMGGIQIDTATHALRADGSIIDGLYCAGEVTGGIHGANRLGGNAVVDTVVFGKIAGTNAAKGK